MRIYSGLYSRLRKFLSSALGFICVAFAKIFVVCVLACARFALLTTRTFLRVVTRLLLMFLRSTKFFTRRLLRVFFVHRYRVLFFISHLLFLLPFYPLEKRRGPPLFLPRSFTRGDSEKGHLFLSGVFDFGDMEIRDPFPFWHPLSASPLWLRSCHSFCWISDLRAYAEGSSDMDKKYRTVQFVRDRLCDWLSRYSRWTLESWQPEVVRLRLLSLLYHYDWYASSLSARDHMLLHSSLYAHYRHLRRVTRLLSPSSEDRLLSLIICVMCGLCFDSLSLRLTDERRLSETLEYQVPRGDGFWRGRRGDVHLSIMVYLLEARELYKFCQFLPPEGLLSALDRMLPALKMYCYGDGGLSTFNGSLESRSRIVAKVLSSINVRARTPLSSLSGGFERMEGGKGIVLLDSGSSGLSDFSRHASTSAFEFCYGKDRIVVNCALGSLYGRFSRTSAAHSLLCLGDRNVFSLGYMGSRGASVVVKRVLGDLGQSRVSLSHDGYSSIYGVMVFRDLHLSGTGSLFLGEDRISFIYPSSRFLFIRGLRYTLRFHLHPLVRVFVLSNGRDAILKPNNRPGFRFQSDGFSRLSVSDSLYGGGGRVVPSRQLVLSGVIGSALRGEDFTIRWRFQHETEEVSSFL